MSSTQPESSPAFDWADMNSAPAPATGCRTEHASEVGETQLFHALEAGAVGGGVMGMAVSIAGGFAFWPALFTGVLLGAVGWLFLSFAVWETRRSRSAIAGLVRLIYGAAIFAYLLALAGVVIFCISVKLAKHESGPAPYTPPATIN